MEIQLTKITNPKRVVVVKKIINKDYITKRAIEIKSPKEVLLPTKKTKVVTTK